MAAARFTIGTTNIIQYIAEGGLTFDTEDIDAPDAGRTLDGKMHRARVATKLKIFIRFRPLTGAQLTIIRNLVTAQTFTVKFYDPGGNQVSKTMYKGKDTYDAQFIYDSATGLYINFEMHFIEV